MAQILLLRESGIIPLKLHVVDLHDSASGGWRCGLPVVLVQMDCRITFWQSTLPLRPCKQKNGQAANLVRWSLPPGALMNACQAEQCMARIRLNPLFRLGVRRPRSKNENEDERAVIRVAMSVLC